MTPALIKSYFPEFATLADDFIQLYIDQASLSVNASVWLAKSEIGIAYLTGHLLTMVTKFVGGVSGPVSSEKVGDLSRNYAQLALPSANEYSMTSYGIEFYRLRKSLPISPMVL